MAKTYRTAMGKIVDIDALRLANESVIAVGNMRTNARGDELGAGGQVVKTRAQIMSEYHKINTPTIDHSPLEVEELQPRTAGKLKTPMVSDEPLIVEPTPAPVTSYTKPRGSFAEAIASETEVKQELLDPVPLTGSNNTGVKRI